MRFYRSYRLFQVLFQKCLWHGNPSEKVVHLTFDDGPTPEVTPFVLSELAKYDAQATFFCVGENVERYPDIFQSVLKAGHSVGNHTYSHLSAWQHSNKSWRHDFEKAEALIDSRLMRPPYGKLTWRLQRYLVKKKFKPVMWSFITYDFDKTSDPERAIRQLKSRKRNGEIVVMHDQPKATENIKVILPALLEIYSKNGFKLEAVKS